MSQSDLLFVLHAGGVYQPDASANRVFASDFFPVYLNKEEFVQIAMSLELLLFPLPELSKNRSNQTWVAYIDSMRRFATMDAQSTAFHQAPVFGHTFAIQHSMFDMRRPTRASEPMKQSDFVRRAGKEIVTAFRALTATAISNHHCNARIRSSSNASSAKDYDVASTPY